MLAIRLEKELEKRIAELRYLEDQEDIALARRAKKTGGRGKSIAQVRKALGLDR